MITRRLGNSWARLAMAAALAVASGCGAPSTDKKIALQIEPNDLLKKSDAPASADALAKTDPAAPDAAPVPTPPANPGILARKTESYARTMQTALAHHAPGKSVATPGQPPQDSLVQWLDPNQFKIGEDDSEHHDSIAQTSVPTPAPNVTQQQATAVSTESQPKPPAIQTAMTQANAGAAVEPMHVDAPRSAEPGADKASAVLPGVVDSYETRITKRLKDFPRDVSANLDYQAMLFLRDEPVPQLSALTNLPTEDRELISAVMDGLSNFRSTLRSDNNMLFSRKIRPIVDLADRLKQQAELSIPTLVLCTRVDGFGRYDPIDPPRFPAQKEAQAIVYCELENFASHQNDSRQWQTDVTQEAILYTEEGMQVWADKTQTIQDVSRHRRHDFFLRTLVKFPSTLTVGRYMLKVTIVDRQANRVAEASLPIQIAAQ